MDYKKIGEELRKIRIIEGLTQEQLADKTGEYRQHIVAIENGNRKASYDKLQEIFSKLGYTFEITYKIKKEKVK